MYKEIIKYRDLLWMLTLRDIKIRYKQAAMGFAWAIFMPIIAACAGMVVKTLISIVANKPMDFAGVVSITVKVLPYTFFISSIRFSVASLVGNHHLVTKIYFPREVLPFASVLACLFDLAIASVPLAILLSVARIGGSIHLLWLLILIPSLVLFTAGMGLLLSQANLFFRDVKHIVETILMFGMFFTPVFYEAEMFGKFKPLLLSNPVASILESMNRAVVLHQMPEMGWLLYAVGASVAMFLLGMFIFHRREPMFAENI
ncbi:MAG: ABC transporter permease [Candidatus Omnitrophica bacterium]|nr:ABC transporter permease [Candidatus Omnitrophota bacterium]